MAITKTAKSMTVDITKKYIVMAGKIEKTAETIKLVATCGNIELYSEKKIKLNGSIN